MTAAKLAAVKLARTAVRSKVANSLTSSVGEDGQLKFAAKSLLVAADYSLGAYDLSIAPWLFMTQLTGAALVNQALKDPAIDIPASARHWGDLP